MCVFFFVFFSGYVSTFLGGSSGFGNGVGTVVQFNGPLGIATDTLGSIYIADTNGNNIRKCTSTGLFKYQELID